MEYSYSASDYYGLLSSQQKREEKEELIEIFVTILSSSKDLSEIEELFLSLPKEIQTEPAIIEALNVNADHEAKVTLLLNDSKIATTQNVNFALLEKQTTKEKNPTLTNIAKNSTEAIQTLKYDIESEGFEFDDIAMNASSRKVNEIIKSIPSDFIFSYETAKELLNIIEHSHTLKKEVPKEFYSKTKKCQNRHIYYARRERGTSNH